MAHHSYSWETTLDISTAIAPQLLSVVVDVLKAVH
jgi:hypothetical protein